MENNILEAIWSFSLCPAADVVVQMQSTGGEEQESMNMESAPELNSGGAGDFLWL